MTRINTALVLLAAVMLASLDELNGAEPVPRTDGGGNPNRAADVRSDAPADSSRLPRPDVAEYQPSPPMKIYGDGDHLIEKRIFQPKAGEYAIRIDEHSQGRIIIRNCVFLGAGGAEPDGLNTQAGGGILAWKSSHLTIEDNYFEFIRGFCIRVMGAKHQPATLTANDLQRFINLSVTNKVSVGRKVDLRSCSSGISPLKFVSGLQTLLEQEHLLLARFAVHDCLA